MTAYSAFHFLHILVFAVIAGLELPAMHALRLARSPGSSEAARTMALRVKRFADAASAIMLVLILPLGVQIGAQLGVYTVTSNISLYITWAAGMAWLAVAVISEAAGDSRWARRIYKSECVLRIIIGLGNIYDAALGFMGESIIQTHWLATKVLLLGLVLVVSGLTRWQTQAARFASLDAASANAAESERLTAIIRRAQWGSHSILAMVLIAAYMGTAKPW
ncbi:MAG: hypothetical protein OXF03_01865 [Gammaproteobacteria bacterium]|nr:hypothetical protein [Gammaproteobacteria bacterium]